MLVVLTGGTGGAKLVQGLSLEMDPRELVIVCNTADDFVRYGLKISPDLDTITYTLAGVGDAVKGWGIKDDTFVVLEWLERYGGERWFKLGDRDLATHITRSALLREGLSLSQATERIRKALGVKATVLPMSDEVIETRIVTPQGDISFQEFFVRDRWAHEVERVYFVGVERSRPAPGVIDAIRSATAVVICPSNPVTSIGPILSVPGVRKALGRASGPVLAVSPIIQTAAVSGPAVKLMSTMGLDASAVGVARAYADFLDTMLIAPEDQELEPKIRELGVKTVATSILMGSLAEKRRLAREVLALSAAMC